MSVKLFILYHAFPISINRKPFQYRARYLMMPRFICQQHLEYAMSTENELSLDNDELKVSYGFGLQFGQQLKHNFFDGMNLEAAIAGMTHIFQGGKPVLSEKELNDAYANVQSQIQAATSETAKQCLELGMRYMEENAKRDGVTVTQSGLQYEILEAGEGEKPGADATVRTHYHGTFIDGDVFDSSVERNEPAEFGVSQVIPGWTEILQMMSKGSKWRVTIPAHMAYGDEGSPPVIPGNSALVFEIQLIDII